MIFSAILIWEKWELSHYQWVICINYYLTDERLGILQWTNALLRNGKIQKNGSKKRRGKVENMNEWKIKWKPFFKNRYFEKIIMNVRINVKKNWNTYKKKWKAKKRWGKKIKVRIKQKIWSDNLKKWIIMINFLFSDYCFSLIWLYFFPH